MHGIVGATLSARATTEGVRRALALYQVVVTPPGIATVRFVITGEWNRNRLLQTIVVLYALYVAALWLTNALLYFAEDGPHPVPRW